MVVLKDNALNVCRSHLIILNGVQFHLVMIASVVVFPYSRPGNLAQSILTIFSIVYPIRNSTLCATVSCNKFHTLELKLTGVNKTSLNQN